MVPERTGGKAMASTEIEWSDVLLKAAADRDAANSEVERLRAEAARINAALANAEQAADRMEATYSWLTSVPSGHGQNRGLGAHTGIAAQAQRFGKPIPETANTDLCVRALAKLGGRAKTVPIREYLARQGHELTQEQVRGSLKYLSKKKPNPPVLIVGIGEWAIAPGFAAAHFEQSGVPALNGAGRDI